MSYLEIAETMKNFKTDIENRNEMYESLRKRVIEILGEADYQGFYKFFLKLLQGNELKYLIIMSRRCLVLCQIFIIFIILDKHPLNEALIVLSDKAIPCYGDKLNGKVGVADDILIHGRTIRKIYKVLKKLNHEIEPYIYGYKKDIDLDCLSEELKKITEVYSQAYKTEWRDLSNKIVRCIYASNVPYTSFVTSFFQYDSKSIFDKLMLTGLVKEIDNTDETQCVEKLKSWYCYEKVDAGNIPLFEKLLLAKGIRFYWNQCIEKSTIIPYVFIKRMNLEEANVLFKEVSSKIPKKYICINTILNKQSDISDIEDDLIACKMRLLTCLLSRLYWLDILNRYNLNEKSSIDIDTMEKSFGQEIANELINIKLEEMDEVLKLQPCITPVSEQIDNVLISKCMNGVKTECLRRYFQKSWYEDERRAARREERSQGISIDYILECFEENIEERQEILARLINIWDTGIAAANYAVDETHSYVACYNTAGEQSYRVIIEDNPYIFYSLSAVSKLVRKSDAKDGKSFEQYRCEILFRLLDELNNEQEIKDYEDIRSIIQFEDGYLNAWNQVKIIESALKVIKPREEQKAIVMKFIKNNF